MGAPMRSRGPLSVWVPAGGGTCVAGRLKEPLRTAGTAVWVSMAMSSKDYELIELPVADGPKVENSDNLHKGCPGGAEKAFNASFSCGFGRQIEPRRRAGRLQSLAFVAAEPRSLRDRAFCGCARAGGQRSA